MDQLARPTLALDSHHHSDPSALRTGLAGDATGGAPGASPAHRQPGPAGHGDQFCAVPDRAAELGPHPLEHPSPVEATGTATNQRSAGQAFGVVFWPDISSRPAADDQPDQLRWTLGLLAGGCRTRTVVERTVALLRRGPGRGTAVSRMALGRIDAADRCPSCRAGPGSDFQPGAHPLQPGALAHARALARPLPAGNGTGHPSAPRSGITVGVRRTARRPGWRLVCAAGRTGAVVATAPLWLVGPGGNPLGGLVGILAMGLLLGVQLTALARAARP